MNMGAERGPSRESMGWWMKYATEHNITKTTERAKLGPVGRNGFDAGREAAMARTATTFEIEVRLSNEANEGWLAYVLGLELDPARSEIYRDGWQMAYETRSLDVVRDIFAKQPELAAKYPNSPGCVPQYVVRVVAAQDRG